MLLPLILVAAALSAVACWLNLRYAAAEHERITETEMMDDEFLAEVQTFRPGSIVDHL